MNNDKGKPVPSVKLFVSTKKPLAFAVAALAGNMLATPALADARIEGTIAAAGQEVPLEGVQLHLLETHRETISQRDGRFVFLDVKPGDYTLQARYIGSEPVTQKIHLNDEQTLSLDLQLRPADATSEIVVIGQAASINKSLNRQRTADNIITVVSADAIGQLPDTNVSEALQRLPGVSIERDQGEGRYVRVRGMGPDYNAVTINGVSVPGPDAGRRAVALDVIPSDLLESLVVTKSLTPDMDANSLGGSIDVQSLSAFDRDGLFYQMTAEGSYDENSEKSSPKFSVTFSDKFSLGEGENNLGIAIGASKFKREFGSDNVETGGEWELGKSAVLLNELQQRDYHITRERSGLTFNLDYKPDSNTHLYWRNLYSEYTDAEIRLANIVAFKAPAAVGVASSATAERQLKDRTETQKIISTSLGGETHFDEWTLDYKVNYNKSGEDEPKHLGGATFKIDSSVINKKAFDIAYTATDEIRLSAPAAYYQAASYKLDKIKLTTNETDDEAAGGNLDFTRDLDWGRYAGQLKFGVKYAERNKQANTDQLTSKDFTGDKSLANFAGTSVDYKLGQFGPAMNTHKILAAVGKTSVDLESSEAADVDISEDTRAAYVMGHVDIDQWRLLTGVRYESTDFTAQGNSVNAGTAAVTPQSFSNKRDYFLPAIHLRYSLDDSTQVRAAWTHSVVRPSFEQLSPGRIFEEVGDEIEASFGNPDLKPLEASNIDLGIEHFMGTAGTASAFLFYKDIDNFTYQTDLAGTQDFSQYAEALTFANGDKASVYGVELAASKQFTQLPEPWNGLLVGANATFTHSRADIGSYDDGVFYKRSLAMPSQSDKAANLMLGYESGKLSMRLSANYKSRYLLAVVDPLDADRDQWVDAQTQLDFSFHYFITDAIKLNFEALNLTDEVYYTYMKNPGYNVQYERYGSTYKLGVTFISF